MAAVPRRIDATRSAAAAADGGAELSGAPKFGLGIFCEILCFHCERRKSSASKFRVNFSGNLGALAAKLMKEIWVGSERKSGLGQPTSRG